MTAGRLGGLPNLLSLVRIPLGALLWVAPDVPAYVLGLVATAGVSDLLDGWAARRSHGETATGAWLDPLCDKAFLLLALGAIYLAWRPPVAVVLLTATREIFVVPMVLLHRAVPALRRRLRVDFRAAWAGKATTVAQFGVLGAILLAPALIWPLAWLAFAAGLLAAGVYLTRALRAPRAGTRLAPPRVDADLHP